MHFAQTHLFRPTLDEASSEATKSPDTHWTSQLTRQGMTRIARSVVMGLYVPPAQCNCDSVTAYKLGVSCDVH